VSGFSLSCCTGIPSFTWYSRLRIFLSVVLNAHGLMVGYKTMRTEIAYKINECTLQARHSKTTCLKFIL